LSLTTPKISRQQTADVQFDPGPPEHASTRQAARRARRRAPGTSARPDPGPGRGQWPTGESLVRQLAGGPAAAAEDEPEPERKTRLRQAAALLGGTVRDVVAVDIAASVITEHLEGGGGSLAGMSAQPVAEPDPDDPVEILRVLPERFHEQFRAEYTAAAAEAARHVEGYRALHDLLRLWRLTAAAYTAPGFEARLAGVRAAVRAGSLEGSVPIEEVVPDWPARLHRR